MKKTQIILLFNLVMIGAYVGILFAFDLFYAWFSIALMMIAIPELYKSIIFKRDSSLYLGSLLGFYGVCFFAKHFTSFNIYSVIIVIAGIGFASFMVFLFFRQNIHLKVVAINFFEMLLLIIYNMGFINTVWFIIIQSVFAFYILLNLVIRSYINIRST